MRAIGLLALLASGAAGGFAQEPSAPMTQAPASSWRSPAEIFLGPVLRARIGEALREPAPAVPDGGPMRRRPPAVAAVGFKAGPQRLAPDRVAAGMKALDAKGRKAAATNFRAMLDAYERDAPKHDVAHALAFCLGTCREVARGRELSPEEAQDLARRAAGLLPQIPEFEALSDRDRQAMYEGLVLTGCMVGGVARQAGEQKDEATARKAAFMARQVLALFGLPDA